MTLKEDELLAKLKARSGAVVEGAVANLSSRALFLTTTERFAFREPVEVELLGLSILGEVVLCSTIPRGVVVTLHATPTDARILEAAKTRGRVVGPRTLESRLPVRASVDSSASLDARAMHERDGVAGTLLNSGSRPPRPASFASVPPLSRSYLASAAPERFEPGAEVADLRLTESLDVVGLSMPDSAASEFVAGLEAALEALDVPEPLSARCDPWSEFSSDAGSLPPPDAASDEDDLNTLQLSGFEPRSLDVESIVELEDASAGQGVSASPIEPMETGPEPILDDDGATVRFESEGAFRNERDMHLVHGGLVVRALALPLGARRTLELTVPGRAPYRVNAKVLFSDSGRLGFMLESFAVHKPNILALLEN